MYVRRFAFAMLLSAAVPLCATRGRVSAQDTAAPAAGPRTDHAVGYYDPALRRVVLVGGAGDPRDGVRDSVWSWSGRQWEPVAGDGPPGRVNAAAAFDVRRGVAIVAGGSRKGADGAAWLVAGDAWENGRDGWRKIADIPARDHHALVEDDRGGVLLFGGIPAARSSAWPTGTFALEGDGWLEVATDGPAARGRTALAYDTKRRQVVLFGGVSAPSGSSQAQTFLGDTWIWQDGRWRKAAEAGPRGRYAHGMVFDERAGVVLLYSGAAAHRDAPLADMWQWDGERWTEIALDGPTPGHRYQPVMVYDRARQRTVLYGGIGGAADTWEWDGRRWQRVEDRQQVNDRFVQRIKASIAGREHEPAGRVFRNIRFPLFKPIPAGNLLDIMDGGYSRALGVTCTHCHVETDFSSDEKRPKRAARAMAGMHRAINQQLAKMRDLESDPEDRFINCGTCHRGSLRPQRAAR